MTGIEQPRISTFSFILLSTILSCKNLNSCMKGFESLPGIEWLSKEISAPLEVWAQLGG